MLQINNVVKKYGTQTILSIPSLHFNSGLYWIKGANGSGKTTFLKMVAGLLPFEGDILVNDISIKEKPTLYRRQISWSEAEPLFPNFLRGIDVIKLYCNIREASQNEADRIIALFQMSDYISDAIGTYSAGMTKKLSLLLSFLGKASLLLLDEPLITLDADTVSAVCHFIVEKYQGEDISFLISSHQDIDPALISFNKEFVVQNKTVAAL